MEVREEKQKGGQEKEAGKSRRKAARIRRRCMWSALLVLFLLVLAGGVWGVMKYGTYRTAIQARLDIQPDEHAREGSLYGESASAVDPGDFWVLVNQLPAMEEGSGECSIAYENPPENHYSARISLYLKETGKLLGYTRRVDPGNYVETIEIKKKLPVGEYPVRANIELFQDQVPAGNLSMDLTLRVTEKKTVP